MLIIQPITTVESIHDAPRRKEGYRENGRKKGMFDALVDEFLRTNKKENRRIKT
jgi:hypothetical protein